MSLAPPLLDRRLLLLGAAGFAAPALAGSRTAEIAFQIDDGRLRALFGRRLRDGLKRLFAETADFFVGEIVADVSGVKVKLRRAEDLAALAAALPRLDPGWRDAADGLRLADGAKAETRIDWSAAALDAQAALWRDRAKKKLDKALAPRNPVFADRDARNFTLALDGMDRAQWRSWIGARIDLFFPAPFSLAPVVAASGPAQFAPRPFSPGGVAAPVAVAGDRMLGNEDDVFRGRVEGAGRAERLVLELSRAGADLFAAKKFPAGDKAGYALMFDKALAALAVLDGPASDGLARLRIERGMGAAELAERILVGGSAPMVRQVAATFG